MKFSIKDFFSKCVQIRRKLRIKTGSKRPISNKKLKYHLEQHFTKRETLIPLEIENPQLYSNLKDDIIAVDENPPTAEEVKKVIKNFENNKSTGTDNLETEGLQNSNKLLMVIVTLMMLIWVLDKIPTFWLHCSFTFLFKNNFMSCVANYRSISLGAGFRQSLSWTD